MSFVLETTETCYQATEPPGQRAAKGLVPGADDPALPTFRRAEPAQAEYLRRVEAGARERVCMISAYVVVITRGADGEAGVVVHGGTPGEVGDVLVLCRRSGRTRNGWGTLSATAGGVRRAGPDRRAARHR